MTTPNQNPEQIARDKIDAMLQAAGWVVQPKRKIDLAQGRGVAVREYQTDVGPADYVLFVDRVAVGVIEAKPATEGHRLTVHEAQTAGYATAKLKWVNNQEPLPFLYESTGTITQFTDGGGENLYSDYIDAPFAQVTSQGGTGVVFGGYQEFGRTSRTGNDGLSASR